MRPVANPINSIFSSLWKSLRYVVLKALDTDIEYQTKEPEFAKYGVLMPVFDIKFKQAKDPLDDVEKMWIDTVKKMLKDENLRKHYSQTGKVRAKEFDVENIASEWSKLLNEL